MLRQTVTTAGKRRAALGFVVTRPLDKALPYRYVVPDWGLVVPYQEDECVIEFGEGMQRAIPVHAQVDIVPALRGTSGDLEPVCKDWDGKYVRVTFSPVDSSWLFATREVISLGAGGIYLLDSVPDGYGVARLEKRIRISAPIVTVDGERYLLAVHRLVERQIWLLNSQYFGVDYKPAQLGLVYETASDYKTVRVEIHTTDDDRYFESTGFTVIGGEELALPSPDATPRWRQNDTLLVPALVAPHDVLFATTNVISVVRYTVPLPDVARTIGIWDKEYDDLYSLLLRIGVRQ